MLICGMWKGDISEMGDFILVLSQICLQEMVNSQSFNQIVMLRRFFTGRKVSIRIFFLSKMLNVRDWFGKYFIWVSSNDISHGWLVEKISHETFCALLLWKESSDFIFSQKRSSNLKNVAHTNNNFHMQYFCAIQQIYHNIRIIINLGSLRKE